MFGVFRLASGCKSILATALPKHVVSHRQSSSVSSFSLQSCVRLFSSSSEQTFDTIVDRLPDTRDELIDLVGVMASLVYPRGRNMRLFKKEHFVEVMEEAAEVYDQRDTLCSLVLDETERVTIVGDTHGQLQDVFAIFQRNGFPSSENKYIFNGDMVDRGGFGSEILMALLLFQRLEPDSVYITRGNHEDLQLCRTYGFWDEISRKFGQQGGEPVPEVGNAVEKFFTSLPLGMVVNSTVLVVHGGPPLRPPDSLRLDVRGAWVPGRSPYTIAEIKDIDRTKPETDNFVDPRMQILWSDPASDQASFTKLNERGAGTRYHSEDVDAFLKHNNLELIVRSHEVVYFGCVLHHDDRVNTIFSASHYTGNMENFGSYMALHIDEEAHRLNRSIVVYDPPLLDENTLREHDYLAFDRLDED